MWMVSGQKSVTQLALSDRLDQGSSHEDEQAHK
jgi:hypothetical protein